MVDIKYIGIDDGSIPLQDRNIIKQMVLKIANKHDLNCLELTIIHPYIAFSKIYKLKLLLVRFLSFVGVEIFTDPVYFLLGISKDDKVLFVSHENLDRNYWWSVIGKYLQCSDVPRLTFWPNHVDPLGERFPYWYNYVKWDGYSFGAPSGRYGKFLNVDLLMKPLVKTTHRIDKAIYVGSHLDFPRGNLSIECDEKYGVVKFGSHFGKKVEDKYSTISSYKYSFCPENSVGLGYDTEKLPEAWGAGCVPVSCFLNPYTDFNIDLLNNKGEIDEDLCYVHPLLRKRPSLLNIEKYLESVLLK